MVLLSYKTVLRIVFIYVLTDISRFAPHSKLHIFDCKPYLDGTIFPEFRGFC